MAVVLWKNLIKLITGSVFFPQRFTAALIRRKHVLMDQMFITM